MLAKIFITSPTRFTLRKFEVCTISASPLGRWLFEMIFFLFLKLLQVYKVRDHLNVVGDLEMLIGFLAKVALIRPSHHRTGL